MQAGPVKSVIESAAIAQLETEARIGDTGAMGLFGFYAATAVVVNSSWQREVLPLFGYRRPAIRS